MFNLKNDIVNSVGQLTKSDSENSYLKSNVWKSESYLNFLHSKKENIRYDTIEPFNIYPRAKPNNEFPAYNINLDDYSLVMNFKQGAPNKGDKLIFEKIIDLPIDFNSSNILSFTIKSSYYNKNLNDFFKYTVSVNHEEFLHEEIGLYCSDNNISIILNDKGMQTYWLSDCQDWNWGENVKIMIKDIKLESTGKFYDSHLSYSSPYSKAVNLQNNPLISLLKELSKQNEIIDVFIPGGNKGDGLIYQGAYSLFSRFGIEVNTFDKVSDLPNASDTLIVLGSGGFSRDYHTNRYHSKE